MMTFTYFLRLAWKALLYRKLRTSLTIGGMAIGIGLIVFLVSLGFGLQRIVIDRITNVEALTVLDVTTGSSSILTLQDANLELFRTLEHVTQVSPSVARTGQVVFGSSATDLGVFGVDPEFMELEGINPIFGSELRPEETRGIILSTTATELLGFSNPGDAVNQSIVLRVVIDADTSDITTQGETVSPDVIADTRDETVNVVGIVDDTESVGYVPLVLLKNIGIEKVTLARVKVSARENLDSVRAEIEDQGFQVDSVADTVGQVDQIFFIIQIVLGALGLIAMIVAALGAFNTLTVSLLERTREIGVMKSLGVTNTQVYIMFFAEALLIAVLGGVSGILLGLGMGGVLNIAINQLAIQYGGQSVNLFLMPTNFTISLIVYILIVGFVTGVYPAYRAAKINPLDALRYE